jgi:hypothetical protein
MWLLLSKRFRRFLLLSIAIPLASMAIRAIRTRVERRTGPTRATGWLSYLETVVRQGGPIGRPGAPTTPSHDHR